MVTNAAFEELVAPLRAELHAHCYRMLGSVHDADDALQDTLLGAWRGFAGFEASGSLRAWLFKSATNACLAVIVKRPKRLLADDYSAAATATVVAPPLLEPMWIEPYPDDPAMRYEQLESVELAFIAALQYLPATQRAALLLRDVVGFSADEVAMLLETTVASITSALQRGRASIAQRVPSRSQQATLRDLGEASQRALVSAYVDAWSRRDVDAIVAMLSRDAKFTMPPIPTWFDGRASVERFLRERVFAGGSRLALAKADAFQLVRGDDALSDYQHTPPAKPGPFLHLTFCKHCGVRPFTKGGHLPALGSEFYAINVATLDDLTDAERASIPIRYVDGRHDDLEHAPAETRHL